MKFTASLTRHLQLTVVHIYVTSLLNTFRIIAENTRFQFPLHRRITFSLIVWIFAPLQTQWGEETAAFYFDTKSSEYGKKSAVDVHLLQKWYRVKFSERVNRCMTLSTGALYSCLCEMSRARTTFNAITSLPAGVSACTWGLRTVCLALFRWFNQYVCVPNRMQVFQNTHRCSYILWHADPFLGNARNTRTQQQKKYCKKCFLCGPHHAHC
jgi:hypothetical protein